MIRMVRTVALLSALAFCAVAGPVHAAAPATSTTPTTPTPAPNVVTELLDGVLAPLAPVVEAVLTGFDDAFTVGGKTLIKLFVPAN